MEVDDLKGPTQTAGEEAQQARNVCVGMEYAGTITQIKIVTVIAEGHHLRGR